MKEKVDELDTLRVELEHYRTEKEKIRDVIGQVGGRSTRKHEWMLNVLFLSLVLAFFTLDVIHHIAAWHILPPAMLLSVAVLLVSVKIIWMIHRQAKVDHFQFWILNSIEFQMNMLARRLANMEKTLLRSAEDDPAKSTPTLRT